MRSQVIILMLLSGFFTSSCKTKDENGKTKTEQSGTDSSQEGTAIDYKYDLTHPKKKLGLPPELLEISGNSWVDKDHLLVIEDLRPNLYLVKLGDTSATVEKKVQFKEDILGKKFDVEDVTMVNNIPYALWSHGSIYKISNWQSKPQVQEIQTFLSKDNNTEGICYDPVTHNLLVACKNESDVSDEKKSTRAIYQFDLKADTLQQTPFMLIHKKDFKEVTSEKVEFFPSAIAVHPITHDIYILSTKDTKCMAVYTHEGKFKAFELIDKELMPQPEGICFSPDGLLYISTEGKEGGRGYILEFDFKK